MAMVCSFNNIFTEPHNYVADRCIDITDPNNYVKLYDYTTISVEFYIAKTNHGQCLHHVVFNNKTVIGAQ
jgi:hypothetical protein